MGTNTMDRLTQKIVIEFAKIIELFGLTPLESRLFAHLYLSEKTMTLDEMSEVIGKSKTSMSTSIRSLSELNLVTQVWKKGVRKDLYQANTQLFKLFIHSYINRWIDATSHQKHVLEELKKDIYQHKNETATNDMIVLSIQLEKVIEFHAEIDYFFRNMIK